MAIESFGWPVTVNPDWGIKNLEYILDHPLDISERAAKARKKFRMATKEDMEEFMRVNLKND